MRPLAAVDRLEQIERAKAVSGEIVPERLVAGGPLSQVLRPRTSAGASTMPPSMPQKQSTAAGGKSAPRGCACADATASASAGTTMQPTQWRAGSTDKSSDAIDALSR